MTVLNIGSSSPIAESNTRVGGFVPDSAKKLWIPPAVDHFDEPDEVWATYESRASVQELAGLALLIRHWKNLGSAATAASRRNA